MRRLRLAVLTAVVLVLAPAAAARADDLTGARDALALTQQRLSFMSTVAATKWINRSPIEDATQEASVLATARQLAVERELDPASVANFFAVQIDAAKRIQLGWGEGWLMYGYPADAPAPDLAAVRPQIAALAPAIADALTRTARMHCVPNRRAALIRAANASITIRYADQALRDDVVDALLRVRTASRQAPCSSL